jgi:hypothetical protein
MIHPDTYVKNTPKGLGLFAGRPFQKGEILWIADDVDAKIPLEDYKTFDSYQQKKLNIYSYLDNKNRVIIPWDEGKYVNHSCAPNSTGVLQFDNISIAKCEIEKDEEIVEDYYSYFGHFESFQCRCGSPACRGVVEQENSYHSNLRFDLSEVAQDILELPQPLLQVQSHENHEFLKVLRTYAGSNVNIIHYD